jgi:hypothetical protein
LCMVRTCRAPAAAGTMRRRFAFDATAVAFATLGASRFANALGSEAAAKLTTLAAASEPRVEPNEVFGQTGTGTAPAGSASCGTSARRTAWALPKAGRWARDDHTGRAVGARVPRNDRTPELAARAPAPSVAPSVALSEAVRCVGKVVGARDVDGSDVAHARLPSRPSGSDGRAGSVPRASAAPLEAGGGRLGGRKGGAAVAPICPADVDAGAEGGAEGCAEVGAGAVTGGGAPEPCSDAERVGLNGTPTERFEPNSFGRSVVRTCESCERMAE